MPWTDRDAKRHTSKASSPKAKRQWETVANRTLEDTGDEGKAIRYANAAVARRRPTSGGKKKGR